LKKTFKEGLKKKLKLAIIGMPRITIVEVTNSAREIEEEMSTLRKNKRSQPLSDNENLDEESMDHE
jgi:hypothetical protein